MLERIFEYFVLVRYVVIYTLWFVFSIVEMEEKRDNFYTKAADYWSEIPATVDGMLGGFGHISQVDIKESKMLLKRIFKSNNAPEKHCALDCGAGIGRITKFLLTDFFDKVDMVEQNPLFLDQAKTYLGPKCCKVENFYSVGLQHFKPEIGRYDLIWVQWVTGHLTDTDFVNFLKYCQTGLKSNGVIVLKENVTSSTDIERDETDSSVTRPIHLFEQLFELAGMDCFRKMKQTNFPKGLYSVYMFVLKQNKLNNNLHPIEVTNESISHNIDKNDVK